MIDKILPLQCDFFRDLRVRATSGPSPIPHGVVACGWMFYARAFVKISGPDFRSLFGR